MVTSGVLLLHWLGRLTFWRDEWDFLLHRRSWSVGTFLDPFVEHLVAASILIYKVGVSAFGMDSGRPFQVVAVALFLLSVALLFVYVGRRVGEWLALAAILPILFLGPSWDDLLFPFQMALFGSVACGIAALLAIERRDRTVGSGGHGPAAAGPALLRPRHPIRGGRDGPARLRPRALAASSGRRRSHLALAALVRRVGS